MPQLIRLAIVAVALLAGLAVARIVLVPETFGDLGPYRAAAIDEIAAQRIRFAGHLVCADCHADMVALLQPARHGTVACEVCHGPAEAHTRDFVNNVPSEPRDRGHCPVCHGYNPSRPTGFAQIDEETHNVGFNCINCHDPHQPVPMWIPMECAACHGEIAQTLALSLHGTMTCTDCHTEAGDAHKDTPNDVPAGKPETREECGRCHAEGADAAGVLTRVDMATHIDITPCWQCHYPHSPGVS
jgi:hypothetical protein